MKVCGFSYNAKVDRFKKKQKEEYYKSLELVAKYINRDSEIKKKSITVMALLLYTSKTVYAVEDQFSKVNKAGNKILSIVRNVGYWICIIGCIVDIVKMLLQGDTKGIAKIMMKYAIAFSSLYFFPLVLNLIKEVFA